jgi:hypothetical protein
MDPQARADDDEVDEERIAHELRLGDGVHIAQDEPEPNEDHCAPGEHGAA